MSLTLPAQTLRGVAIDLRRLNYTPTSWQGLLSTHSEAIRLQLEPLLVEMVREGAHPRLMALLLDRSQHGSTEKCGLGQPNHMLMSTGGWS